jgi:hypothetical protein
MAVVIQANDNGNTGLELSNNETPMALPDDFSKVTFAFSAQRRAGTMNLMATNKQHAHELIERLAPSQITAVVGLLEAMLDPVARSLANAPVDDEPVSEQEAREIATARDSLDRGEGIPHEQVLADFGLSSEDWKRLGRTPVDSTKANQ